MVKSKKPETPSLMIKYKVYSLIRPLVLVKKRLSRILKLTILFLTM